MKLITNRIAYVSFAFLALASGCSSDPADVTGDYTIAVTNGKNECADAFPNWTVGMSYTGIAMTVTQSGSDVEADFGGTVASVILDIALGSHKFTGTVDGSDLDLKIVGSGTRSKGNCAYTVNAHATGNLQGDILQGEIDYTTATNENPDCAALIGCHTVQTFNGTRPPSTSN